MDEKSYLNYIDSLSKSRIDKNFKRGVIDEKTSAILKTLKDMMGKVRPKNHELELKQAENAKLESKLAHLKTREEQLLIALKNSPGHLKAIAALKKTQAKIKAFNESINKNKNEIKLLTSDIELIRNKYSRELSSFQEGRSAKLKEIASVSATLDSESLKLQALKRQVKIDKKLLDLEKNINKKFKGTDGHAAVLNNAL